LDSGIKVIACFGETLQERKSGNTFEVVKTQIDAIISAVGKNVKNYENIVLAYEPVITHLVLFIDIANN
jgi:triosephosphate isomerase (TIM)